ncbi:hypothetical protein [Streptomyces sp. NPDC005435]|uniref:hypothetical protein n=1 Tax=Streptomyces sp. NPDC005435 TaxID=3154464 RepID=UPI0034518CC3
MSGIAPLKRLRTGSAPVYDPGKAQQPAPARCGDRGRRRRQLDAGARAADGAGLNAGAEATDGAGLNAGTEATDGAGLNAGAEATRRRQLDAGTEAADGASLNAGAEATRRRQLDAGTEAADGAGLGARGERGDGAGLDAGPEPPTVPASTRGASAATAGSPFWARPASLPPGNTGGQPPTALDPHRLSSLSANWKRVVRGWENRRTKHTARPHRVTSGAPTRWSRQS